MDAGLVDELHVDIMPVFLGIGLRSFESSSLEHLRLEKIMLEKIAQAVLVNDLLENFLLHVGEINPGALEGVMHFLCDREKIRCAGAGYAGETAEKITEQ